MPEEPKTITLCGSMRFMREMLHWAKVFSLQGHIVLMPYVDMRTDGRLLDGLDVEQTKNDLDALHLAKINQSNEVYLVCPGDYIGESGRAEMEYARRRGNFAGLLREKVL